MKSAALDDPERDKEMGANDREGERASVCVSVSEWVSKRECVCVRVRGNLM